MPKKTRMVLSAPEWAVEYVKSCRFIYKITKGQKLRAAVIKNWIDTLENAEKIFLNVEPLLRYREGVARNPMNGGQCLGAGHTVRLLREARSFLVEMLGSGGRPVDLHLSCAVFGLVNLYKEKTGAPHYGQVGEIITKEFSLEKIDDVEEWARKTATRYAKLLKNKPAFDRASKIYLRNQILNDYRSSKVA